MKDSEEEDDDLDDESELYYFGARYYDSENCNNRINFSFDFCLLLHYNVIADGVP